MISNALPTVNVVGGEAIGGVTHMPEPSPSPPAARPASRGHAFLDGAFKSRGSATTGAEMTEAPSIGELGAVLL